MSNIQMVKPVERGSNVGNEPNEKSSGGLVAPIKHWNNDAPMRKRINRSVFGRLQRNEKYVSDKKVEGKAWEKFVQFSL